MNMLNTIKTYWFQCGRM